MTSVLLPFPAFLSVLLFFHSTEYLLAAKYNNVELSWRSLLLSQPYGVAMGAACVEYALEKRLAPYLKVQAVSWLGLGTVVLGEMVRKAAMVTAKQNFTHVIQFDKREEHQLVVHGIYRWMRHPGYAGWLLWAVGTQLLLCNPICTLGFTVVAWVFFKRRIALEEELLVKFFGNAYTQYRARVPSGLPFMR